MEQRILIYSHDTFGLGNIRRNHALARRLVNGLPDARVLLLTSSRWFHFLPHDPRIEFVKLPELTRVERGAYRSRAAGVDIDPLVKARREILVGASRGFRPTLCLVDKVPLGVGGELRSALAALTGCGTRIVLALRDILDEPAWTRRHWESSGQYEALDTHYEAVWVFGDERVFPTREAYRLDRDGRVDVRYLGYIDHSAETSLGDSDATDRALVTVGGGEDGRALLSAAADALESLEPSARSADVVLGPLLSFQDRIRMKERLACLDGVRFLDYTMDIPRRIRRARCVIAMAGYNTVCEVLASETPALIMPRTAPSREQILRATAMGDLGYFRTASTAPRVQPSAEAIRDFLRSPGRRERARPDLSGLTGAVELARCA